MTTFSGAAQKRLENFVRGYMAKHGKYLDSTSMIVQVTLSDISEVGYDPRTRSRGCKADVKGDLAAIGQPMPINEQMQVGYVISPSQSMFGDAHIQGFPYDYVVARYAPNSIKHLGEPIGASAITSVFMDYLNSQNEARIKQWGIINVMPSGPCKPKDMDNTEYECPLFIETTALDKNNTPTLLFGRFVFTHQSNHWVLDEQAFKQGFIQALIDNANQSGPSTDEIMGRIQRLFSR